MFFAGLSCRSQGYFPFVGEAKVWSEVYDFHSPADTNYEAISTTTYKLEGEFVANGNTYKQSYFMYGDPSVSEWETGETGYREDSGRVYSQDWFEDNEKLLYDFNLEPGDSIYFEGMFSGYDHVGLVDSVIIDGAYHKRIHFDYPPDIWVEGLGSMFRPFSPLVWSLTVPDCWQLLCVSDANGSIYVNPAYNRCYIDTVMTAIPAQGAVSPTVRVLNNPMEDCSVVDTGFPSGRFTEYSLYNTAGLMVRHEAISGRVFTIRRENLSPGIYILEVLGAHYSARKKIIVV